MISKYCFLNENNDITKTVWSYKKQQAIINTIIEKYPEPINLKEKLLSINNLSCKILSKKIDPDWNMNEYISFIKKYIIKYSKFGKFILASLIGSVAGIFGGYYLNKYLNQPSSTVMQNIKNIVNKSNPTSEEDSILDNIIAKQQPSIYKNIAPYAFGIGLRSLIGYGTYNFIDSLDKKSPKRMPDVCP